jgi:hypothetical protein
MATINVPLRNDLFKYKYRIDLDGTTYSMDYRFNPRIERWVLDFKDFQETPIVTGIILLLNVDLLGKFVLPLIPPGTLFLFDINGSGLEMGKDDPNINHLLLYEEAV